MAEMNREEWEALCDGCARCCLYKLQDDDTGEIFYTNVVCKLLDTHRCRCRNYAQREKLMPTCLVLDADMVKRLAWMPKTCAMLIGAIVMFCAVVLVLVLLPHHVQSPKSVASEAAAGD